MTQTVFISRERDTHDQFVRVLEGHLELEGWTVLDPSSTAERGRQALRQALSSASGAIVIIGSDDPTPEQRLEWSEVVERQWGAPHDFSVVPVSLDAGEIPEFLKGPATVLVPLGEPSLWEGQVQKIERLLSSPPAAGMGLDATKLRERLESVANLAEGPDLHRELVSSDRAAQTAIGANLVQTLSRKGALHLELNQQQKAISALQEAASKLDRDIAPLQAASIYYNLGGAYLAVGDASAAAGALRKAQRAVKHLSDRDPLNAAISYKNGLALKELGKTRKAKKALGDALKTTEAILDHDDPTLVSYRQATREVS